MATDLPPNPLDKPGYRLDFHDEFDGVALDRSKWVPFYLPQWSSRERSAASHRVADGTLILQIAEEQAPWCPEFDGGVRCSSLQTGLFAGPLGSTMGQHRFRPEVRVREVQPTERLYVPRYGYFELRARAELGRDDLAALWMIGFEDASERSGEITICELFGKGIRNGAATLGYGIKPVTDPNLTPGEFHEDVLPFDPAEFHIYAAEWRPEGVDFYLDNRHLGCARQSPAYPMQFMLNVYALPPAENAPGGKQSLPSFTVDYFRAWQPVDGYPAA
jgi:hypothetical protein